MENFTSYGQMAFYAVTVVCGIVWSVSHLFKTMTASYDGIVQALQKQNAGQQSQLDGFRTRLESSDKDCDEKIQSLRKGWDQSHLAITDLQEAVKKINGNGGHK